MPRQSYPSQLPPLPDPDKDKAFYLNLQHDLDRNKELSYADLVILVQQGHQADQEQLEDDHYYEKRKEDLDSYIRGIVQVATKKDLASPLGRVLNGGRKRYFDDPAAMDVWKERYTKVFVNSSRSKFAFQRIKDDLKVISRKLDEECMTAWTGELTGFEVKPEFEPAIEGESNWWNVELRTRVNKLDILAESYLRRLAISSQLDFKAINHAERYCKALKRSLTDEVTPSGSSAGHTRGWWLKRDKELRVIEHLFAKRDAFSVFKEDPLPTLYRLDHVLSRLDSRPSSSHSHDHEKNASRASLAKFRPIARIRAE